MGGDWATRRDAGGRLARQPWQAVLDHKQDHKRPLYGLAAPSAPVLFCRRTDVAVVVVAAGVQVACDFGTDCTDCGPYMGVVPTWG